MIIHYAHLHRLVTWHAGGSYSCSPTDIILCLESEGACMGFGNPLRPPDKLDKVLYALTAKHQHEYRMKQIRNLDIEKWTSEVANE